MRRLTGVRALLVGILAILALLVTSVSAMAAQWPIGSESSPALQEECLFNEPYDAFQWALDTTLGRGYAVPPSGGAITSWSTWAGGAPGQLLGLKVFRPVAPNTYLVVGQDGPRALAPNVLNTFPVSIPVQAGDLVGLSLPAGSPVGCRFEARVTDRVGLTTGNAPIGASIAPQKSVPGRLNVSAIVLPPPTMMVIQPVKGSFQGGRRVSIYGDNFASVVGVSFGSMPALGFEVVAEALVVAIAPPGRIASRVPITVTTAAGSVTSTETFAYEACRVPRFTGSTLKAARRKARKAECRIGRVKRLDGATAKTGKIVRQSPKPGKVLSPGTKIKVTLLAPRAQAWR